MLLYQYRYNLQQPQSQQVLQQQQKISLSQIIYQIAQQIANANPGTNENYYIKYLYNWLSKQLFSVFLLIKKKKI
jgi:hypothetical protein